MHEEHMKIIGIQIPKEKSFILIRSLTRSSERIFYSMRYAGTMTRLFKKYIFEHLKICSIQLLINKIL